MATFQAAYTRLMRTINRPLSETDVLQGAKDAINDAILQLQRNHAYTYTERLNEVIYPANTLSINLGTICGGKLRNMKSIQQIGTETTSLQGLPMKIMTYDQLQALRNKYARRSQPMYDIFSPQNTLTGWTLEDGFRCDRIAFLMGQALGLYPIQQSATTLVMNNNIWLPVLAADSDTNFFLEYALDVVIVLALKVMHIFMKLDSRFAVTDAQVTELMGGLVAWDSSLSRTSTTNLI